MSDSLPIACYMAQVNTAKNHHSLESAFEKLQEASAKLEVSEPDDEKNVEYYAGRFRLAKGLKHRKWFANELGRYARGLEEPA